MCRSVGGRGRVYLCNSSETLVLAVFEIVDFLIF